MGGVLQDVDEGQLDGYLSTASSVSDSDEEFTLSYYQRRGTRGGRGRRRGRSGVSAGAADVKSEARAVSNSTEGIGYTAKPYPSATKPPPLLSKVEGERMLVKSGGPSLIKPHRKDSDSGVIVVGGSGGRGGVLATPSTTHIQPPPGLIMPSMVQRGKEGSKGPPPPRRQPPPLVRKGEEPGHIPIQPKVYHPKIVLPSSDGDGGTRSAVNSFSTSAPSPSFVTAGASRGVAKVVSSPAVPPVKRRPGRPRKDQSAALANSQTKKTSRTAPYGLNKPHPKPQSSRSTRGQGSSLMKGMKLTQYEFQSQQQQPRVSAAGGGVARSPQLSQQHVVAAASPTSQQYQPLILSSGAASTLPMTPLQILPAGTHQATSPVQVQTYPTHSIPQQGGMIYLQGTTPSLTQEQPTYVTKDGQLYQLIQQTRSMEDPNDNAKKISVIMQPQPTVGGATFVQAGGTNFVQATAGGTSFVQAGEVGGFRYVTQLDGTPPNVANTPDTREELQRKFRKLRQAVSIQQLDGLVPLGGKGRGEVEGGGDSQKEAKRRRTMSPGEASCDVGSRSCDIGREILSAELRASDSLTCTGLPDNSNNNCNGGSSSCEEGATKGGAVCNIVEASSSGEQEPPPRKRGRPRGRTKWIKSAKKICSDSPRGDCGIVCDKDTSASSVDDATNTPEGEVPKAGRGRRLRKSVVTPEAASQKTSTTTIEGCVTKSGRGKELLAADPISDVAATATTPSMGRPRTASTSNKIIKCPKCDVTYCTKGGLKAHLAAKHPPDLPVSGTVA